MEEQLSDKIKTQASMSELLNTLNILPIKNKNTYRCLFHIDKNPSAGIIDDKVFHCFVCNKSWSVIDVAMKVLNCDCTKACRFIDNKLELRIMKILTEEEENEIELAKLKREQERRKKLKWKKTMTALYCKIAEEIALWHEIELATHITRGEYKNGNWACSDEYFFSLKKQKELEELFDLIDLDNTDPSIAEYIITKGDLR